MDSETSQKYILDIFSEAAENLGFNVQNVRTEIIQPDLNFGDFATNAALVLAKQLKRNPQEVAVQFADELKNLDQQEVFSEIYAAAGFINFRLSQKTLLANLSRILLEKDGFGSSQRGNGKTMVVEYFQNNVAKPPHVGHLRSAVIGDSILRVLKSQGYKTISDTHIGDWGVQFGILIFAFKEFLKNGGKRENIEKDPIVELNKLYVEMSNNIEQDPSLRDKGKEEFVSLEKGDTENRELWQWFVKESLEDFDKYRSWLDVLPFNHNLGESFYEDKMPAVLEGLNAKGLITTGETGESYVDLESFGLGRAILVKSDGGTTYLLRDLATYIFRKGEFDFYKNIYVVDNRQSHHFKQMFKVMELFGYKAAQDSLHVDFGFMSLPEGAISTRKGTTVNLKAWIEEANKEALEIINEKNPELENKEAIAKLVALAAIKYFDLSHNRKTEITFTWENALSFEGNTGPYMQYAHARIFGILRKSNTTPSRLVGTPLLFKEGRTAVSPPNIGGVPADKAGEVVLNQNELFVLRKLYQFPQVLKQVSQDFLPNLLCNYLFELSQAFNSFYESSPVLQEKDPQLQSFRLNLITATAQVIKNGLYLLGIEAPEEM